MQPAPSAVLWDMDGTLVDTEPYWMRAEIELVEEFGGEWTHEDGMRLVGLGLWKSALILQEAGVQLDTDAIVDRLTDRVQEQLATEGVPWRPGARELLAALRAEGVKTALVTMSIARMAEQIVSLIGFDAFDLLVTGDRVEHPKPHPEAYLTAAAELGVPSRSCVAIEDSVPGLASAVASGAVAIGVPHHVELAADESYTLLPTLEGVGPEDIAGVYRDAILREEAAR